MSDDSDEWLLLNALRGGRSRLIYSRGKGAYFLHPGGRWFAGATVDAAVAGGLLELAGLTPGVYRLSERGRARWQTMPDDTAVEGACDECGRAGRLHPRRYGETCWFLCAPCRRWADAQEEVYVIEASYPSPVV